METDSPIIRDSEAELAREREERPVGRLRRWLFGAFDGENARLRELFIAIGEFPQAPVNYVLRGELYLKHREYALAEADFTRALKLASEQLETSNWGLIEQTMQDRALLGLRKAQRYTTVEQKP